MTRKSPIRHQVKRHRRQGKWVKSFPRGKGSKPISRKSSRTVGVKNDVEKYRSEWERQRREWEHVPGTVRSPIHSPPREVRVPTYIHDRQELRTYLKRILEKKLGYQNMRPSLYKTSWYYKGKSGGMWSLAEGYIMNWEKYNSTFTIQYTGGMPTTWARGEKLLEHDAVRALQTENAVKEANRMAKMFEDMGLIIHHKKDARHLKIKLKENWKAFPKVGIK